MELYGYLKNISGKKLTNVNLTVCLPPEISYRETYTMTGADGLEYEIKSSSDGGQYLTFYIPNMETDQEYKIDFWTLIADLDLNILMKSTSIKGYATVGEETYYSNVYTKNIQQRETYVEHTWEADVKGDTLENGQKVTYTFTLKNDGLVNTGNSMISTYIPDGLELQNIKAIVSDGTEVEMLQDGTKIFCYIDLTPGQTITLSISFIYYQDLLRLNQTIIENQINVIGVKFDSFDTDVITYKVTNKYDVNSNNSNQNGGNNQNGSGTNENPNNNLNNSEVNNGQNNNNENNNSNNSNNINNQNQSNTVNTLYRISGLVWLDKNKDGINKNEDGMEGIEVYLFSVTSNGNISNKIATTTTDSSGEYIFTGLNSGYYIVCFKFDNTLYAVTPYQVRAALVSQNSDAISKTLELDGNSKIYGVTDTLDLTKTNLTNIDMGLVTLNDFDLSLEKYISQIIVKNNSGETTYKYNPSDTEKLEIRSKYYKSTVLEITYNIVITNEGDISGYVNKIIDYLPNDLNIDLNKNPGWYYSEDESLYYNGLIGTEITSGSSKTVQLVVTKDLSSGESANIVNSAEIAESTNSYGYEDLDSSSLNNNLKEDDQDMVTLIVTVSTGALKENAITLIILLIVIFLIVFIKRNKITFKKVYK